MLGGSVIIRMLRARCAVFLAIASVVAQEAHADSDDLPVDLELVLAVDVSGSIDAAERLLQRQGCAAALRHLAVVSAIRSGEFGRISVIYFEWSGPTQQSVVMPWHLIEDVASAESAAATLDTLPTPRRSGTSISNALLFALGLFGGNGYAGTRRVIDVSGDGPNNGGASVVSVRDLVITQGIIINGLPVVLHPGGHGGLSAPELQQYFQDCVIGGNGSFMVPVESRDRFADAIRRKLIREIRVAGTSPGAPRTIRRASISSCDLEQQQKRKWRAPPTINDHPYDGPSLAQKGMWAAEG